MVLVTAPCELDEICYPQAAMLEKYLNSDFVWDALRVPSNVQNYSMFSGAVNMAFILTNVSLAAFVFYRYNSALTICLRIYLSAWRHKLDIFSSRK